MRKYEQSERATGNGCVVNASWCPRLGFEKNETRLDKIDSDSHTSLVACKNRASAYWTSCTKDMLTDTEKARVKIKMLYYDHGTFKGSGTYP